MCGLCRVAFESPLGLIDEWARPISQGSCRSEVNVNAMDVSVNIKDQ